MNGDLVYRADGMEIVINLHEPDEQGRKIIADLHGSGMSRDHPVLFCEATGRPQSVYLREVRGAIYASHHDGSACTNHSPSPMSDEHKRQIEYVVRAADSAGFSVETEVSLGTGVRPDVVVHGEFDVAVEVQRSALSKHAAITRTAKAIEAGLLTSTWISDRDYPASRPNWFWQVPSVGMNKHLWDAIPPRRGVTALGLREVYDYRCVSPAVQECVVRKGRPCGGWHVGHRPLTGMTLDDVAEMAPEGGIVPINWFDQYTLLVSPGSRALFEGVTGRSPDWRPAVRPPRSRRNKPLYECPRPVEDEPGPSALASQTDALIKMPEPPRRVRVQPGVCGVPAAPGSPLTCGARAQLYPGGWRCDAHRPGRNNNPSKEN
jgi:hypothetical protein